MLPTSREVGGTVKRVLQLATLLRRSTLCGVTYNGPVTFRSHKELYFTVATEVSEHMENIYTVMKASQTK